MSVRTFRCEGCGGTFGCGWKDEDAEKEYEALYGKYMGEDRAVICDDCHDKFLIWFKAFKGNSN